MAGSVGDKAPLPQAMAAIARAIVQGALAGETPPLRLDSVDVELQDQIRFAADGSPLLDTDEPNTRPVRVTLAYKRAPEVPTP